MIPALIIVLSAVAGLFLGFSFHDRIVLAYALYLLGVLVGVLCAS